MKKLAVSSPSFENNGLIPLAHTGYGEDASPALQLDGLCEEAVSIAVLLNDMDHPIPAYNHWVIWNLPPQSVIPGNISSGAAVEALGGAVQGLGYGKHCYRGPKPPFNWSHVYHFNVYVLDCSLNLPSDSKKRAVLAAMEGHILQQSVLAGHYR